MSTSTIVNASRIAPRLFPDPGESGSLRNAWRQAHYAAQALSEVGKLWATPRDDDSHSALGWNESAGALTCSADSGAATLWGALSISTMRLGVNLGMPTVEKAISLEGRTFDDAIEFVHERGRELVGEFRQPSVPAPDLPDHELGRGGRFEGFDPGALGRLERLYGTVAWMLGRLRVEVGEGASGVQCWPHHFDMAVLAVLGQDDAGAMTETIGVGLTPPDSVSDEGYIYVSPWKSSGTPGGEGALKHGSWKAHMAVLELSTVRESSDEDRALMVSEFIASAFNNCVERLERD